MIENSTQGLTLLDADHDAQVLGTEHHSTALERWAPYEDGRARRVAAELSVAEDGAGGRWIEVLIDGEPVGGLSPESAARHSRHIEAVLERGGRPAANGLVRRGEFGPQLELRLPDPAAPVRAPLPPAGPSAERPDAATWPREPRSRRVPLLIGGGVLALLLVVGVVVGTRSSEPTTAASRTVPTTSALPTTTTAPTPTPTTSAAPAGTSAPTTTRAPRTTPRRTKAPTSAPRVATTPPPAAEPPPAPAEPPPPAAEPPAVEVPTPPVVQCPPGQVPTGVVVGGVVQCAAPAVGP